MIGFFLWVAVVASGWKMWRRLGEAETRLELLSDLVLAREEQALPQHIEPQPAMPSEMPVAEPEIADAMVSAPVAPEPEPAPALSPASIAAPPAPAPHPAPPGHSAPRRAASSMFEEMFGSRLPIWAGGITLAVAGLFLVKYSIDTGLLSPPVRVLLGLAFAVMLVVGAEAARRVPAVARDPRVAQSLAGAGIAVGYTSLLIAANLYHLVSPGTAFFGLAAVTIAAIALALRFGAPSAVLGLVGGLSAPALVGGAETNAPVLALYLMLVIAALAGVARRQGWRWLAIAATIGGFGWGAALIATRVIDVASAGATGFFLLLLAFAVPVIALGRDDDASARTVRLATVAAAAVQLALLVGQGGFAPLEWGFYGLLSIGATIVARIDAGQRMLPPLALAVALATVLVWPAPPADTLTCVAMGILLIFAAPALLDAWHPARGYVASVQGVVATLGMFTVVWVQTPTLLADAGWATLAGLLALLPAAAAALGWSQPARHGDERFAMLVAGAGALAGIAIVFAVPVWLLPPAFAVLALALMIVAVLADDPRVAQLTMIAGGVAVLSVATSAHVDDEFARAFSGAGPASPSIAFCRYGATAALLAITGLLGRDRRADAQWFVAATLAAAAGLAQVLPPMALPAMFALAALGLAFAPARGRPALLAAALLTGIAMLSPLAHVLAAVLPGLAGRLVLVDALPAPAVAVLRLAVPGALLTPIAWRLARSDRPLAVILIAYAGTAIAGALYVGFKQIFAITGVGDFIEHGMAERVLLTQLLFAAGVAAWYCAGRHPIARRVARIATALAFARLLWFDMLLCNPLVVFQSVGSWPLANLLIPAYGLPLLWLEHARRREPEIAARFAGVATGVAMASVLMLVATTLRQLFHGSILTDPGVLPSEDIARSLTGIALSIGFLRYGIGRGGQVWRIAGLALMVLTVLKVFLVDAAGLDGLLRIASFIALGFSLIGVGWLYNRYLSAASH